ncbi:hypothetical protein JHK84_044907 [Glycine max]|uniref:Uncharacterized protein n=2 Tax=Glycine soja TaxID=3848 RepID=A0A445GG29_GLYSO|nr:hypothetical protein JHK86_044797 [Glycine max]KAG4951546.1 hypothetical protein JHK85_045413 [Glycine max]KAG5108000.1 hypothetical protein JHK84_044907 [Glycine max]RZB60189.1 hypothetical protein D0Y65_043104 [Glycine soja]
MVQVKILKQSEVAPPPCSLPSTIIPLTFFDIPSFYCNPIRCIFFYDFPHPTHHFLQTALPILNIRDLVDTLHDQQQQQQVKFGAGEGGSCDDNSSDGEVQQERVCRVGVDGPTIKALIAMASGCFVHVLPLLIRFIRSPLVDEILCNSEIPKIVGFLRSSDLGLGVAALDCVLELGYIGRMEVVEAMLKIDLVEILMDLQREEGCCESDCDFAFECCVSRFAIQVEVGEGLSGEEKREVKSEILRIVKEASQSEAEFATVSVEILWGSSP